MGAALNCPCTAREAKERTSLEGLKVLELFAGIGGWRLALDCAVSSSSTQVAAYDSGPHCSEVYQLNFGERCSRRNIEQLSLKDLEHFDLWLMSPPCQPFSTTREAKQRDLQDKRCAALEHLTKMLPKLQHPPRWIALENVKGFHGSRACSAWRAALQSAGFRDREIILDLMNFGTPNHRTRYYLLAERETRNLDLLAAPPAPRSEKEHLPPGLLISGPWASLQRRQLDHAHAEARQRPKNKEEIFLKERARFLREVEDRSGLKSTGELQLAGTSKWKLLPLPRARSDALLLCFEDSRVNASTLAEFLQTVKQIEGASWCPTTDAGQMPRPVGDFLEVLDEEQTQQLTLSREVLSKPFAPGLSYVGCKDVRSFCFTGHYGKVMHKSSGSLLYLGHEALDRSRLPDCVGSVRFFSPKEILNFLGFPRSFTLPRDMDLKHLYKVVGNSIAVTVTSQLLKLLLRGEGAQQLNALEEAPRSDA